MADEVIDLTTSFKTSGFLPTHLVFLNGDIHCQDLVQTLHILCGLGADLTICDQKDRC